MAALTPPNDATFQRLAAELGERLRARNWRLATAESSTAGLIGHIITMIPGASEYYVGGVICYTNLAKERELNVDAMLIADCGAVSADVAAAMAEGAWHRFGVQMGLAVTGIAGPDGATHVKPIGLHFIAAARVGHPPVVERHEFGFARDGNRAAAAAAALELAIREASTPSGWCVPASGSTSSGSPGTGAAGVALLAHHAGAVVDGCDLDLPSPYTPPLAAAGIPMLLGHDPAHLVGIDRVAITPAIRAVPGHVELEAARATGLTVVTWQAILGELMAAHGHIGLAVTGRPRQVDDHRPARPPAARRGNEPHRRGWRPRR